jgi:hypothetical protein
MKKVGVPLTPLFKPPMKSLRILGLNVRRSSASFKASADKPNVSASET